MKRFALLLSALAVLALASLGCMQQPVTQYNIDKYGRVTTETVYLETSGPIKGEQAVLYTCPDNISDEEAIALIEMHKKAKKAKEEEEKNSPFKGGGGGGGGGC